MNRPNRDTILGFDYGTRFIGVAVGSRLTGGARPLAHLKARDGIPRWEEIECLLTTWQPEVAVVGLPLHMDGSESELSRRARKFGNRLHGRFGIQVICHDERLSSFEARQQADDRSDLQRGGKVDSLAAVVIVEHWLAEQPANPLPSGP